MPLFYTAIRNTITTSPLQNKSRTTRCTHSTLFDLLYQDCCFEWLFFITDVFFYCKKYNKRRIKDSCSNVLFPLKLVLHNTLTFPQIWPPHTYLQWPLNSVLTAQSGQCREVKCWRVNSCVLTDQVMEHCIFGVTFWDGVLGIKYSKLCRIFKGVLHKTKIK